MDTSAYLQARREQFQRALELHNILAATVNILMAKSPRSQDEDARLDRMLEEGSAVDFLVRSLASELGVTLNMAEQPVQPH